MKLKDFLIEKTRDDAWWVDDALQDKWDNDYVLFYDEVRGMVEELGDMYPDNPSAKKAQKYFMKEFDDLKDAKVSENEYSEKFIHHVLGTDHGSSDIPFNVAVQRLREFEKWVNELRTKNKIYFDWKDIEDHEYENDAFDYDAPYDPYKDRGVKRSDF